MDQVASLVIKFTFGGDLNRGSVTGCFQKYQIGASMKHKERIYCKLRRPEQEGFQAAVAIRWLEEPEKPFEETVTQTSPITGEVLQIACLFTQKKVFESATGHTIRNCSKL